MTSAARPPGDAAAGRADRPPPPVTVTGGPGDPGRHSDAAPARADRQGSALALVAVLLALGGGVALASGAPPDPPPPPAPAVAPGLRVVPERLVGSQGGVLVVAVEVENRGPAARLEHVQVWAEPVREDPASSGATRVAAGGTAGVVALLAPDCRLLQPGSEITFVATVQVRLRGPSGPAEAVLDLAHDPAVAARVAGLCAGGATGAPAALPGPAAAAPR